MALTKVKDLQITYKNGATGSVVRGLREKLDDVVSVEDFGAVGDGSTNDAASFALALTAATGKTLIIPPATYKINSALTVGASTTIIGYGATLDFSGAGNIVALTLGSNVTLLGFKLIGAGNGSYNASGMGIKCFGTDNSPSAPTYVTGPTIQDVEVTEFSNYGIHLKYTNHGRIARCKITECGYAGIGGLSCNRLSVENNYIGQITPGTGGNCYGVFVDRSEGTLTADPRSNYVRIVGNMVEDVTVWEAIDTHGGNQFLIANNVINNCKKGIVVTDSEVSNVPTYGPKNVVISGNAISALTTGNAILVNGAVTGGSTVDHAENISIVGNTIESGGLAGDAVEGCIKVRSSRNVTISGNTLRRPIVLGIHLYYDNESFSVTGNTVVDPNDATQDSSCVATGGNNNKGYIGGNTFVVENTGLATKVAERSIYSAGGTGIDVVVGDNAFVGLTSGRLAVSSFAKSYTAGDTTPSVLNTKFLSLSNAGAVTITNLDDSYEGQEVTLFFNDGNTTIDRSNAYLSGGVNFVGTANDTLTLRKIGSVWIEVGRGVNA